MLSKSEIEDIRKRLDQCLRLAKHTTDGAVARALEALADEYRQRLRSLEQKAG